MDYVYLMYKIYKPFQILLNIKYFVCLVVLMCENILRVFILGERNYYEMSSFVENRAERVMKNKLTSARFIQYDNCGNTLYFYCCISNYELHDISQ